MEATAGCPLPRLPSTPRRWWGGTAGREVLTGRLRGGGISQGIQSSGHFFLLQSLRERRLRHQAPQRALNIYGNRSPSELWWDLALGATQPSSSPFAGPGSSVNACGSPASPARRDSPRAAKRGPTSTFGVHRPSSPFGCGFAPLLHATEAPRLRFPSQVLRSPSLDGRAEETDSSFSGIVLKIPSHRKEKLPLPRRRPPLSDPRRWQLKGTKARV